MPARNHARERLAARPSPSPLVATASSNCLNASPASTLLDVAGGVDVDIHLGAAAGTDAARRIEPCRFSGKRSIRVGRHAADMDQISRELDDVVLAEAGPLENRAQVLQHLPHPGVSRSCRRRCRQARPTAGRRCRAAAWRHLRRVRIQPLRQRRRYAPPPGGARGAQWTAATIAGTARRQAWDAIVLRWRV